MDKEKIYCSECVFMNIYWQLCNSFHNQHKGKQMPLKIANGLNNCKYIEKIGKNEAK